jgi:hypothetical protein
MLLVYIFKCSVLVFAAPCRTVNVRRFLIFSGILEGQVDGPNKPIVCTSVFRTPCFPSSVDGSIKIQHPYSLNI